MKKGELNIWDISLEAGFLFFFHFVGGYPYSQTVDTC